jgi:hypothetical protein
MIFTPGTPRMFVVDDQKRQYSTMTPADIAFLSEFGQEAKSAAQLVRSGGSDNTVHYHLVTGNQEQSAAALSEASQDSETSVDIDFGEPIAAWEKGMEGFSSEESLSQAVWDEIASSHAPPRHIRVQTNVTTHRKKKRVDSVTETQIVFQTSHIARPVDFTIPSDYLWHTNLLLASAFLQ